MPWALDCTTRRQTHKNYKKVSKSPEILFFFFHCSQDEKKPQKGGFQSGRLQLVFKRALMIQHITHTHTLRRQCSIFRACAGCSHKPAIKQRKQPCATPPSLLTGMFCNQTEFDKCFFFFLFFLSLHQSQTRPIRLKPFSSSPSTWQKSPERAFGKRLNEPTDHQTPTPLAFWLAAA